MILKNLLLIISILMLTACSSINRGVYDNLRVDTVPQGAQVTVERRVISQSREIDRNSKDIYIEKTVCDATPCAIVVPRRSKLLVTVEHPGYETSEVYIGSVNKKGALGVSLVSNTATLSAVGGLTGAWYAAGTSIYTLGLTNPSGSAYASGRAGIGLGLGVSMVAVDTATGANLNLYPNPVILGLAPEGSKTIIDPRVKPYRKYIEAQQTKTKYCNWRTTKKRKIYEERCIAAKKRLKSADEEYTNIMKEVEEYEKLALEKAKTILKKEKTTSK